MCVCCGQLSFAANSICSGARAEVEEERREEKDGGSKVGGKDGVEAAARHKVASHLCMGEAIRWLKIERRGDIAHDSPSIPTTLLANQFKYKAFR